MRVDVVEGSAAGFSGDVMIVGVIEGDKDLLPSTKQVDDALGGEISRLTQNGSIKGKADEVTTLYTGGKLKVDRVIVLGLGKRDQLSANRLRLASNAAVKSLSRGHAGAVGTTLQLAAADKVGESEAVQAVVEGTMLGAYRFRRYKTDPETPPEIQTFTLIQPSGAGSAAREAIRRAEILGEATNLARDLANEPGNRLRPPDFANRAREIANDAKLEIEVLGPEQMEKEGMEGVLAVNQGSSAPSQFVIIKYRGRSDDSKPTLGLVGKGVTFDSGGLSIKPSDGMMTMKEDMSGGAAVIAAISAIARLKVPLNVTALVPMVENMPSGTAQRPGDVLRMMSGKTVEVLNTDAEGRLILADALAYGKKLGLNPMVDVATLTGACVVALGPLYSGMFVNDDPLRDRLLKAAEGSGEKLWPMPLVEEYKEMIKSDVADIKNVGGREGGAITAALFLGYFAEETPWAHLDIAGPAFMEKDIAGMGKGATGTPVRTLVNLAIALSQD